ncbi:AMP-binding protein [Mycobacterium sp. pW049]|uniref:AMP-binding protein n=1 Tax=[Mycobacterium] bulgaricum TaxID=3238985 RepID=UPI00351AFBBA
MTTIDPLGNVGHRIPVEVLRLQADAVGDSTFLVDDNGPLTYSQVDDLADRHASGYADLGIGKGDTVAFLMENSATLATTAFGVNRLGAAWSPVSTEYRGEWLRELLTAVGSRVLVVDRHLLGEVSRAGDLPFEHIVVNGEGDKADTDGLADASIHQLADFAGNDPHRTHITLDHGETSSVLWTSGTTGRSKGVMQPHAVWTLWAQRHNEVFRGGIRPGESFYYCMPMYNSGGWIMNIMPALITGSQAAIDKRFSASDFWNRLRHFDANHTMTLGTMHVYLFQQDAKPDDADNPLRTLLMNPVIPQLMKPFMERFGIELVASGFGQSEIMGATLYTSDMPLKVGSSGYTVQDDLVETKLLDNSDEEVAVDEIGEICVRPRVPYTVFSGYLGQPEETMATFRNMWHHTGDLGRRDSDGEIFFVDRKKDSLRHKGRNTSTFEVEHIARQFPGVANAAALGVRVAELQHEEELMVVLLRQPDAYVDPLEFCKFMDERAPYFFVPRYVEVVDELPMTPTNKIQKFILRDRGIGPSTWDRTESAADWQPTRPAGSPKREGAR